ncbi:MAG: substrate-binding domain-containing protein [Oscillospiraceae bacterium]|nr:substrate-binding domain-containing protein [Oscillospiraceae bacterium]
MRPKPLYSQIVKFVKEKIHSGAWAAGDKIPSEKELAEMFNVSSITSKRALRELQVMKLIDSKKGVGSFVAETPRDVRDNKTNLVVSLVMPRGTTGVEVVDMISGASDFLQSKDCFLSLHIVSCNAEAERETLLDLARKRTGGIILAPYMSSANSAVVATIKMNGTPVVTVGQSYEGIPVSSVVSDNFGGGFISTEHLIKNGHKNIAFLSNVPIADSSSARERYLGFSAALQKYGIKNEFENNLLDTLCEEQWASEIKSIKDHEKQSDFYIKFLKKLKAKNVTALVCSCDFFAYLLIYLCKKIGYSVPGDFSVTGFDKMDIPYEVAMPVTTIEQDFYSLGYKSAEEVWNIINTDAASRIIAVPVRFIDGETVKDLTCNEEKLRKLS